MSEQEAIRAYREKHSTCDIQKHPWSAVFGAGYEAGLNASRAEDRRDLSALLQEFLDQCDNQDCSLCERARAALSATADRGLAAEVERLRVMLKRIQVTARTFILAADTPAEAVPYYEIVAITNAALSSSAAPDGGGE